ncbi:Hypothetical protein, putative, partial [Bodo saltans]
MMKGVAEKLQSFVSFRGLRRRSLDDSEDLSGSVSIGRRLSNSIDAAELATETILVNARVCAVISATDAALAFVVFPTTPALPLFRPKRGGGANGGLLGDSLSVSANPPLSRFPLSSSFRKKQTAYTSTWIQHWQQYLAAEEKRYASPRAAASMYQELARIHPSGADCRMWIVKRLIRWIMKAKR